MIAVVLAAMATGCGSPASTSRRSKAELRRVTVKIMKPTMSVMALNPDATTVRSWPLTWRKAPVLCSLNATGASVMSAPKSQSHIGTKMMSSPSAKRLRPCSISAKRAAIAKRLHDDMVILPPGASRWRRA